MEGGRESKRKVEVSDCRWEVEKCEGTWRDGLKDGARKDQSEGYVKADEERKEEMS